MDVTIIIIIQTHSLEPLSQDVSPLKYKGTLFHNYGECLNIIGYLYWTEASFKHFVIKILMSAWYSYQRGVSNN